MKAVKIRVENKEILELRIPRAGAYFCPICGEELEGYLPYEEMPADGSKSAPSWQICPTCETEYGYPDMISSDSPPGTKAQVWNDLRVKWLNRAGWTAANLQQLKENLGIEMQPPLG
jgi:hypothetical protein